MSSQEIIKDVADALLRLQSALEKHGFSPIKSIELSSIDDFFKFKSFRPNSDNFLTYPAPPRDRDVAAHIVSVEIKRPRETFNRLV